MFNFFKRNKARTSTTVFKVEYVLNAFIDSNKVIFDLNDLHVKYVEAKDAIDAQIEFAKKTTLAPHVYVHKIEKVLTVEK